tara:strand:- start:119 stop:610 length:492 start_codon:yes stop_codon:yes gene_type:complete
MSGIVGISPNSKSGILGGHNDGDVVQVVPVHSAGNVTINDTSNYVSIISATITPRYSTSKIWVSAGTRMKHVGTSGHQWAVYRIERRTTAQSIGDGVDLDAESYTGASGGLPSGGIIIGAWFGFYDSPATTEGRIYDLSFHNNYAGDHVAQGPQAMILMEVKQ